MYTEPLDHADTAVFPGVRLAPMADAADPIAERIALVMELRGWTAAELARRAGLQTPTHISTILKRGGERTSGTVLLKIAAAAGVRDRWLITGEGRRDFDATDTLADPKMRNRDGFNGALAAARARACGVPLWAARWRMETRVLWAVEENHRQLY